LYLCQYWETCCPVNSLKAEVNLGLISLVQTHDVIDFPLSVVIQELGREGVLPRASFFASNKPFNAPLAGLFTQYVVSCVFMLAPPPGDAYLFMVSCKLYFFYLFIHVPSSMISINSILVLIRHHQYARLGRITPFVYETLPRVGLGSPIPSTQINRLAILSLQCISNCHPTHPACAWI
jgi:Amino acid permease